MALQFNCSQPGRNEMAFTNAAYVSPADMGKFPASEKGVAYVQLADRVIWKVRCGFSQTPS